ncbi:MAG TPA: hypothetical protein VHT00_13690, partial [Stellaceae bacterium]|nr:hypothetical protein [Stellaceae bacterium]
AAARRARLDLDTGEQTEPRIQGHRLPARSTSPDLRTGHAQRHRHHDYRNMRPPRKEKPVVLSGCGLNETAPR